MIRIFAILSVGEKAPAKRRCAEHQEVARAHPFAHDALGLGAPAKTEGDLKRARNGFEHVLRSAHIFEHGEGKRAQLELVALGRLPNLDETLGLGEREGVQHHGLNDAVDRRVRAETHSEGPNGNHRKAGFLKQAPEPDPRISKPIGHGSRATQEVCQNRTRQSIDFFALHRHPGTVA